MNKSFGWYLMKLDRLAAWTLLATMLAYFVSGYGMTKGIINSQLAVNIHNEWLPLLLLGSFCFHSCYAISLAFKRWKMWTPVSKYLLLALYLALFSGFVYLNNFYQKPIKNTASNTATQTTTTATTSDDEDEEAATTQSTTTTTPTATSTVKTFTAAELAKYNGQNGQPAYVAISGKVYDATSWFSSGSHYSHLAGTDLTSAFYSKHSAESLSAMTEIGNYRP